MEELTPFRYRGYYYDTETELYYLQTRYYDPETGRFFSADDISYLAPETINGLNLYAYCGNNPVMCVDENGTSFWNSVLKVVGATAILAALAVIAVATAGTAVGAIFAGAAIGGALGFVGGGISGAIGAAKKGTNIFEGFANGALSGTITGAISGAVAASPIGRIEQVFFNTILSAGEYAITAGQDFNWGEFAISAATGFFAGLAGGKGYLFDEALPAKQVFAFKMLKNGGKYLMGVFKPILNSSLVGTFGNTIKEAFL